MVADLHLHTHFSDGTFSPEELALAASQQQLNAVALTDHDTMGGCARMAVACAAHQIEFVPGTELTADCDGEEVHILGYWLDSGNEVLAERLQHFQQVRQDRIHEMVRRLNQAGIGLTVDSVTSLANCQCPGRPHIARALVQGRYVRDYDAAFERFLKQGRPGWVPKAKMTSADAIELIHQAGGVAVLAHPGIYPQQDLVPKLVPQGLDGLECWHSRHSVTQTQGYKKQAAEFDLVATGGSDCHGRSKGKPIIGSIRVPYQQVTELKKRRPSQLGTRRSSRSTEPVDVVR